MSQFDGDGRLWEKFELQNINVRLENLYQHSLNIRADNELPENSLNNIRDGIQKMLSDLESSINDKGKKLIDDNNNLKKENLRLKNDNEKQRLTNDNLEREIKRLKDQIKNILNSMKETEKNQRANDEQTINDLNKKIKNLENEIKKQQNNYDILQNNYKNLQKGNERLSDENKDKNSVISNLKKKLENLENIIKNGMKDKESDKDKELKQLKKLYNKAVNEKNNAILRANNLEKELELLRNKKDCDEEHWKKYIDEITNQAAVIANKKNNEAEKQRKEMIKKYEQKLKERDRASIKARESAIKKLDESYKKIMENLHTEKDNLEKEKNNLKNELNRYKETLNNLKEQNIALSNRLKKSDDTLNNKQNEIDELNKNNNKLNNELLKLKSDLAKYDIAWHHFFGLDMPIKDQIKEVHDQLDKFEKFHNIKSPFSAKRVRSRLDGNNNNDGKEDDDDIRKFRRREITILDESPLADPPLILGEAGSPDSNDPYQRFELYNMDHSTIVSLKDFRLENDKGDVIKINNNRQIRPGHCIGVCLGDKRQKKDDLLGPKDFCSFQMNEHIWLYDSYGNKKILWPSDTERIVTFDGNLNKSPLSVVTLYNDDNDNFDSNNNKNNINKLRGMDLGNAMGKRIILVDCYLINRNNTFKVKVPEVLLEKNDRIKFMIGNKYNFTKNDIVINDHEIDTTIDDTLYITDSQGTKFVVYEHSAVHNPGCYVM